MADRRERRERFERWARGYEMTKAEERYIESLEKARNSLREATVMAKRNVSDLDSLADLNETLEEVNYWDEKVEGER